MSTDEFLSLFGADDRPAPSDPMKSAQASMRTPLPRRFYREASLLAHPPGHRVALDGRGANTPARNPLAVASRPLAEAMAAEWNAQGDVIDPSTMPLTRLVNVAIDGVAARADEVRDEIQGYGGSDLICYRAGSPEALVARQAAAWDPLVEWAREALGARLILSEGVMHVAQPEPSLKALAGAVAAVPSPVALAGLSTATSLTGSVVIALALAHGRLDADAAWAAAHVDEDYQAEIWGIDEDAALRQMARRREFDAAALALASARPGQA